MTLSNSHHHSYKKQNFFPSIGLIEETNDLARNVLPTGLLVVHNASRCGQDNIAELTRRQQLDNPLLELAELDVVAGRDDTSLVDAAHTININLVNTLNRQYIPAVELDDDLARAVVVNLLVFTNVACTSQYVATI